MRRDIVHEGSDQLTYEIREIVAVADVLRKYGVQITWENIGDPIQKGEKLPQWIKDIIIDLVSNDRTYGYVATQECRKHVSFSQRGEPARRISDHQGRHRVL